MNIEKTKEMLDSCYMAKRILDMLPKLPEGVMPSYIRYLETILILQERNEKVKVSNISDFLNLPRPGVTRTVNGMVEKGYLKKNASDEDKRVTYISITEKGLNLFEKFSKLYFEDLAKSLDHISEEEATCMVQTIEKFYEVMCQRRGK